MSSRLSQILGKLVKKQSRPVLTGANQYDISTQALPHEVKKCFPKPLSRRDFSKILNPDRTFSLTGQMLETPLNGLGKMGEFRFRIAIDDKDKAYAKKSKVTFVNITFYYTKPDGQSLQVNNVTGSKYCFDKYGVCFESEFEPTEAIELLRYIRTAGLIGVDLTPLKEEVLTSIMEASRALENARDIQYYFKYPANIDPLAIRPLANTQ
mgnify:FL=1